MRDDVSVNPVEESIDNYTRVIDATLRMIDTDHDMPPMLLSENGTEIETYDVTQPLLQMTPQEGGMYMELRLRGDCATRCAMAAMAYMPNDEGTLEECIIMVVVDKNDVTHRFGIVRRDLDDNLQVPMWDTWPGTSDLEDFVPALRRGVVPLG